MWRVYVLERLFADRRGGKTGTARKQASDAASSANILDDCLSCLYFIRFLFARTVKLCAETRQCPLLRHHGQCFSRIGSMRYKLRRPHEFLRDSGVWIVNGMAAQGRELVEHVPRDSACSAASLVPAIVGRSASATGFS